MRIQFIRFVGQTRKKASLPLIRQFILFLVRLFVYLLFHHVPAAVDLSLFYAGDFQRSAFYVGRQFECYRTEGAGWNEFNLENARFFLFDVGDHLHLAKGHSRFRIDHLAHGLPDLIFQFGQLQTPRFLE